MELWIKQSDSIDLWNTDPQTMEPWLQKNMGSKKRVFNTFSGPVYENVLKKCQYFIHRKRSPKLDENG